MKKLLFAVLLISVVPVFALVPQSMHTEIADTNGQGHFNIQFGADYTERDDTGNKDISLTLMPYYGVLKYWDIAVRIPLVYTIPADEVIDGEFGVANIGLWNKVNVLNEEQYPVGLSVIADVNLPTGDVDKGIGDDKTDISGMAVVSKHFLARIVGIHANVGYTYPDLPREDTYAVGEEPLSSVNYASGVLASLADFVAVYAEIYGQYITDLPENGTQPLNTNMGVVLKLGPIGVDFHGDYGITDASNNYEFGGGIAFGM